MAATSTWLPIRRYSEVDVAAKRRDIDLAAYPEVQRWFTRLRVRPAVQRGMELLKGQRNNAAVDDPKAREILFGVRPTP